MSTITFNKVSIKTTRRWTDPSTGKKRQCTKEFYQTVNPFNRNADGSLKTREQILLEIRAERDAWLKGEEVSPEKLVSPSAPTTPGVPSNSPFHARPCYPENACSSGIPCWWHS